MSHQKKQSGTDPSHQEHVTPSTALFRTLIENDPAITLLFTVYGTITYASAAAKTITGYALSDLTGKSLFSLVHPQDLANLEQSLTAITQVIQTTQSIECRLFCQDGSWRWFVGTLTNLLDHPEVAAFAGTFRDITGRKQQAEQRHQEAQREQEEQQGQVLDALFSSIADFAYTFDISGRFTYVNRALLDLLQRTKEQVIHKNFHDLEYPFELATRLQRQIQEVIVTGKSVKDETPFTSASGSPGYYEYIFVPIFAQDGSISAVAGTTRDISERHQEKEEQKKLDEQKNTFISIASHELRTPLTTIKAALQIAEQRARQVLQMQQPEPEEMNRTLLNISTMLNRALRQVSIQTRLIKDLLDVTRIQQNKFSLLLEPWELSSIVREAIDDQHTLTPARTIVLQELPQEPLPVLVDRDRIGQVLANYLSNALKYSPTTQPITVGVIRKGQQVRIWVQDKGQGLNEEQQKQIWERFYQVQEIQVQSGSSVGLGLGLHICKIIIEQHKGQVGVESEPGIGSNFWFTLPLIEEA
jgi:PAS domain S-box-containing protein